MWFQGEIRESEAFKLQRVSSPDRDHLSAGRRCRGSNDIMVRIEIMMVIMMRMGMTTTVMMMMTTTGCSSNDTMATDHWSAFLLFLSLLNDNDDTVCWRPISSDISTVIISTTKRCSNSQSVPGSSPVQSNI